MTALLPVSSFTLKSSARPETFPDARRRLDADVFDSLAETTQSAEIARLKARLAAAARFTSQFQTPLLTMMLAVASDSPATPDLNPRVKRVVELLTSSDGPDSLMVGEEDAARRARDIGHGGPGSIVRAIETAALITGGVIVVVDRPRSAVSIYLDQADETPFAAWSGQDCPRLAELCTPPATGHFTATRLVLDRCREGITALGRRLEGLQRTNCPCCMTSH